MKFIKKQIVKVNNRKKKKYVIKHKSQEKNNSKNSMDRINKTTFNDPSNSPFVQMTVLNTLIKKTHQNIVVSLSI